jgi:hypothetical protein
MIARRLLLTLLALLHGAGSRAQEMSGVQPTPWKAHVVRSQLADQQIPGLRLKDSELAIALVDRDGVMRPTSSVQFQVAGRSWKVFVASTDGIELAADQDGWYTVTIHLNGKVNQLDLVAQRQSGSGVQTVRERVFVYAPEAMEFQVIRPSQRLQLTSAMAFLSYSQSGFGEFQSLAINLGLKYQNPSVWERLGLVAALDLTTLTLIASPINQSPQYLDARGDVSVLVARTQDESLLHFALAGLTVAHLFPNGSPFGFSALVAPAIGYQLTRAKPNLPEDRFDIRYTFLGSGSLFSGQQTVSLGAQRAWRSADARFIEAGFEMSSTQFQASERVGVRADRLVLRFGVGF